MLGFYNLGGSRLSIAQNYEMIGLAVVQGSKTRYLFHAAPTKDALRYALQKNILIFL